MQPLLLLIKFDLKVMHLVEHLEESEVGRYLSNRAFGLLSALGTPRRVILVQPFQARIANRVTALE